MNKILSIACGLSAALLVAACDPVTLTKTGARLAGVSDAKIAKVQEIAKSACAYLPAAVTIKELFAKGRYAEEQAMAQDICAAVTNNPMAEGNKPGRVQPTLYGVKIKGQKVKRGG